MRMFGINFGKAGNESKSQITDIDRKWVDDCFKWCKELLLPPSKDPFVFDETSFPLTFKAKKISAENLGSDITRLLGIDKSRVSFSYIADVRDISQTPYEIHGRAFESELEIVKSDVQSETDVSYVVYLSNSTIANEKLLLRRLILEMCRIVIHERSPESYFKASSVYTFYLVAIYMGFGLILSDGMIDVGKTYVAGWERTWRSKSEVPPLVIIYALACYAKMNGENNPEWKVKLPKSLVSEFVKAIQLTETELVMEQNSISKEEIEVKDLISKAKSHWRKNDFSQAIDAYGAVMNRTDDTEITLQALVNTGYLYLRLREYDKGLSYYLKTLEIKPNYEYAFNNMGFAYIMLGQMNKAKECLDRTVISNDTIAVYSLRNWAVYFMKEMDLEQSEVCFGQAFNMNIKVDLLEFFYYEYLTLKSDKEEALKYLKISVDKGEPEGIELMNKLKGSD